MALSLAPPAARPEIEQIAAVGPLGGPSYAYRGAVIDCQDGKEACTLGMPNHPLHGWAFGGADTVTILIDLWLEEPRRPGYMKAVAPAR